jgi:iron complex outermembrane receptor protein
LGSIADAVIFDYNHEVNVTRNAPRERRLPVIAMLALAIPHAVAAYTQDTPSDGESAQLQEIIVTATKRTEDIKDIPTSVSAISGDQLAEHHITDYDDITRTVPGVSFQAGAGPGLETLEIRGVSSASGSETVGIYLDEVSITIKNNSNGTADGAVQPKLFDLDRVEVLRGPQGTLYGASSIGGTIRFITKQADPNEFSVTAGTDLSDTKHGGFNNEEYAVLNVPVVDGVFALRFGADISYDSGYIDHYIPTPSGAGPNGTVLQLATNDSTGVLGRAGVNDIRTDAFRVSGRYLGPDDWTVTPAFQWQRTEAGDSSIFYPSIGVYEQDKRVAEPGKDDLSVPSLTIIKDFDWATLTSVTGYFERNFDRTTDGTYYNSYVFANFVVLPSVPQTPATTYQAETRLAFLPSQVFYRTKTTQWSQELRLASKSAQVGAIPITWVAGLYFSNQHQTREDDEFISGLQQTFQNIYGYAIDSPLSGVAIPGVSYANNLSYYGLQHLGERQIAPFGQLEATIAPQLKAALGLRYASATSNYNAQTTAGYFAYGLPSTYSDRESFHSTTPDFSLDYAITDSTNVYVKAAKGFRLGGPTGPDPAYQPNGPTATPGPCDADYRNLGITAAPLKYDSDSLWSYELGSKGRYLDRRLSIDAAVYAINWTNIQQTVNLPTCGFTFTTNAGDAKIYGSEVELRALVAQSLTLSLNAGSTHAYITRTSDPGLFQVGEEVLNVPIYTVTPSADFEAPITDSTTAFVHADIPYTGKSHAYYNSSTVPVHYSPSYGIVNLTAGFTYYKFKLELFAKNLLDSKKIIQYPSVNTVQEGYTVRPLTVGMSAQVQL